MKPMYAKLLRLLEQGKTVLLEARDESGFNEDRLRLVNPKECFYDTIEDYYLHSNYNGFVPSCFVSDLIGNFDDGLNPKVIVECMQEFDKGESLKIVKMQVIK